MKKITQSNNETIDFYPAFERLNEELTSTGLSLELICAGGYIMQRHGYRVTYDVDAFYKSNAEIEAIIRKIGNEFKINRPDESWLNNSIAHMNPEPPDKYCELVYSFPYLKIKAVDIIYLIGMKLISGREQDLRDLGIIIRKDNNERPFELLSKLTEMQFDVDISGLLDAYDEAYGMEWLHEFYVKNQDELNKYY